MVRAGEGLGRVVGMVRVDQGGWGGVGRDAAVEAREGAWMCGVFEV